MVTDLITKLDKIFHDRVRLGIMSTLVASQQDVSFTELVNRLKVTRGNLSVHIKVLETNQFVKSKKAFVDNKPKTTFRVTAKGRKAFERYLKVLEDIIKSINTQDSYTKK